MIHAASAPPIADASRRGHPAQFRLTSFGTQGGSDLLGQ
jgi:hypothetical protein